MEDNWKGVIAYKQALLPCHSPQIHNHDATSTALLVLTRGESLVWNYAESLRPRSSLVTKLQRYCVVQQHLSVSISVLCWQLFLIILLLQRNINSVYLTLTSNWYWLHCILKSVSCIESHVSWFDLSMSQIHFIVIQSFDCWTTVFFFFNETVFTVSWMLWLGNFM